VQRTINYWALLTLGPLLLGLGFYANTHYLTQAHIQDGVMGYLRPVLPYMTSVAALFFLYFVMPNAKVSARAAIWAAAVAAVVWTGAKYALGAYIRWFIPYQAIYGVMGLVPLAVMWIYVTWLIVLFGLQLTYATQHLKTLDAADIAEMKRRDECFIANDLTVMRVMAYIMGQFEIKKCPVTVQMLCERLEMPADFTEKLLDYLVTDGLLFRTSEPDTGYTPATEGGNISLAVISQAVAKVSFAQDIHEDDDKLKQIIASQQGTLQQHTLMSVLAGRDGSGEQTATEQHKD
jgi:membrane protein